MPSHKYFATCLAVLTLATACGKKSDDQSVVPQPIYTPSQDQPTSQPTTSINVYPQMQGSPNYYFVNYQFSENGCTTGLRRFSGPTIYYVNQQVCSALYNESMNSHCAQGLRASFAAQFCSGN